MGLYIVYARARISDGKQKEARVTAMINGR
jgi:hypothetical protein